MIYYLEAYMKIAKIAGLLITVLLCNNLQSMELPKKYPLEEQLLNGDISYGEYLLILEETSQEYGWMLRNLRIAEYDNRNIYLDFINMMDNRVQTVQDRLGTWNPLEHEGMTKEEVFKIVLENLYGERSLIRELYGDLVRLMENN